MKKKKSRLKGIDKRNELYKNTPQNDYITWKQLKSMLWMDCKKTEIGFGRVYA